MTGIHEKGKKGPSSDCILTRVIWSDKKHLCSQCFYYIKKKCFFKDTGVSVHKYKNKKKHCS